MSPSKDGLMKAKYFRDLAPKAKLIKVPPRKKVDEFCHATRDFMNTVFKFQSKKEMFRELYREDYIGMDSSCGVIESYLNLSDNEASSNVSLMSDLYSSDGDSINID